MSEGEEGRGGGGGGGGGARVVKVQVEPYVLPVTFVELAASYPRLQEKLQKGAGERNRPWLDLEDDETLRVLTEATFRVLFHLTVKVPQGNLIPRIPARMTYVHFIRSLLEATATPPGLGSPISRVGIDIGTGPLCVYALLGRACAGWKFVGADVDPQSLANARRVLDENNIGEGEILLVQNPPGRFVAPAVEVLGKASGEMGGERSLADFCMCNPPFFESFEEQVGTYSRKRPPGMRGERDHCVATKGELLHDGGEIEFIMGIYRESVRLGGKVMWYTSLVGKKKSLNYLREFLSGSEAAFDGVRIIVEGALKQGRTSRWVIGWSFSDIAKQGIEMKYGCIPGKSKKKTNCDCDIPCKVQFTAECHKEDGENNAKQHLGDWILHYVADTLEAKSVKKLKYGHRRDETVVLEGNITRNTWGRQYRRRKKLKVADNVTTCDIGVGFSWSMTIHRTEEGNKILYCAELTLVNQLDLDNDSRKAFGSFYEHLRRHVSDNFGK
eukprot:Nk52_evm42s745 gene=Nk52_evmTU42s745